MRRVWRHQLGQGRLLHGQEGADLVAAWADDADGGGHEEHHEDRRGREHEASRQQQDGARDQDAPPAQAVGMGRQPQRDGHVAQERERQQQADLRA